MRRTFVFLLFVLVPSTAHAAEAEAEDDPSDDMRPVEYASVELNALGPLVERHGGQLQLGIMGPLTLVGSVSRIETAAVTGWAIEVGSRLFFGLAPRRADGSRFAHVFLACSFLADDIRVGGTHGERRGVALDAGVHLRIVHGFYALGGVGVAHRSTDLLIPHRIEGMTTTPRLLLSIGWGL